jgi:hypothetical protein
MIELIAFLEQLMKRFPDYKEFNRIQLELDNNSYALILDSIKDDVIYYHFHGAKTLFEFSPRKMSFFRYMVNDVSQVFLSHDIPLLGVRRQGVRVSTSKHFGKYTGIS